MSTPYELFVLPDTGKVQFLANTADPREGKEGTVYGVGHVTTYDAVDLDFIRSCYVDGKIALLEPQPPVIEFEQPTNFVSPAQRSKRSEDQSRRK